MAGGGSTKKRKQEEANEEEEVEADEEEEEEAETSVDDEDEVEKVAEGEGGLFLHYGHFTHEGPKWVKVEASGNMEDDHELRTALLQYVRVLYAIYPQQVPSVGTQAGPNQPDNGWLDTDLTLGKHFERIDRGGDENSKVEVRLLGIANLAYTLLIAPKFARFLHEALETKGCLLLSGSYGLGKSYIAENLARWFVHPKGRGSFEDFKNPERWKWWPSNAAADATAAAADAAAPNESKKPWPGLYHMVQLHGGSDYESFVQATVPALFEGSGKLGDTYHKKIAAILGSKRHGEIQQAQILTQYEMGQAMWSQPRNRVVDAPLVCSVMNARLLALCSGSGEGETTSHSAADIKRIDEGDRPTAYDKKRELLKQPGKREKHTAARPSVLFVDEFSRPADVAAVTGELLYAIENRGKSIPLAYEPSSTFTLPSNFFLVATMNQVDSNVKTKLDTALVQRFFQYKFKYDEDKYYSPLTTIYRYMLRREMSETGKRDDREIPEKIYKFIDKINKTLIECGVPERFFLGPRFVIGEPSLWDTTKEKVELLWSFRIWEYVDERLDDASGRGGALHGGNSARAKKERLDNLRKDFKEKIKEEFLAIYNSADPPSSSRTPPDFF